MKEVHDLTMQDEFVRLDGKHFVDCVFIGCTLEYSGGNVILERTAIHGCKHLLTGYAKQTAEYMRTVGLCDTTADKWIQYTGKVN